MEADPGANNMKYKSIVVQLRLMNATVPFSGFIDSCDTDRRSDPV